MAQVTRRAESVARWRGWEGRRESTGGSELEQREGDLGRNTRQAGKGLAGRGDRGGAGESYAVHTHAEAEGRRAWRRRMADGAGSPARRKSSGNTLGSPWVAREC
jgi:hypothetical protein